MVSGILAGQIAGQGDSLNGKNIPLHTNDALTQFIKCHLLTEQFCVRSKERNVAAARAVTEAKSSSLVLPTWLLLLLNLAPPLETAWKGFQDTCKSAKMETLLYRPLCRFLTLLAGNRYLFIPWDNETIGEDGESLRQGIIAVNAQCKDIDKFLQGDLVLSSLPDEFLYRDDKGKDRSRVYYSDIQMVGEVKVTNAPTSARVLYDHAVQVLKYLFTVSQYQPRHAHHIGFLAYLNGFVIIECYPDRAFFSHFFAWDDPASRLALEKAITDIQNRPFTTSEFEVIKAMDRHDRSRMRFHLETSTTNDVHKLFDLHRGDGWHRNAYVGIGISKHVDERLDWNVVKHYWHDTRQRFNELQILQHIYNRPLEKKRCTAGIVRVDFHNSRVLAQDTTPAPSGSLTGRDRVSRQSVFLVMKSLGQALSSCPSVMEFLKAMYDLVEVHRMLIEDHQVLHRDISWGNVLVNTTHVDEDEPDDLCDRPFIDVVQHVKQEARKVHAMLSDFDCACILESGKEPHLLTTTRGEITGTPMFMARSLCTRPIALRGFQTGPGAACDLVFPQGATGVNHQRRDEVKQFLKAIKEFERLRSLGEVSAIIEAPDHIDHAPIHDAESIFWLIVMFFLRAWPKDYDPKNPDSGERQRRRQRTELFKLMVLNQVMSRRDIRGVPDRELLPPQFHPFDGMLLTLDTYFQQAWHHPYLLKLESDKVSGFRFHGHNALQAVLLSMITQLQETGDIEIKPIPLGVNDDFPFMPYSQPFIDASLKRGASPNAGDDDGKARKRRKKSHATNMNSPMITRSNVDDTARMIEKNSQFAFLMSTIERDRQRKLWFMGDREYVEYAFVEAKVE